MGMWKPVSVHMTRLDGLTAQNINLLEANLPARFNKVSLNLLALRGQLQCTNCKQNCTSFVHFFTKLATVLGYEGNNELEHRFPGCGVMFY